MSIDVNVSKQIDVIINHTLKNAETYKRAIKIMSQEIMPIDDKSQFATGMVIGVIQSTFRMYIANNFGRPPNSAEEAEILRKILGILNIIYMQLMEY